MHLGENVTIWYQVFGAPNADSCCLQLTQQLAIYRHHPCEILKLWRANLRPFGKALKRKDVKKLEQNYGCPRCSKLLLWTWHNILQLCGHELTWFPKIWKLLQKSLGKHSITNCYNLTSKFSISRCWKLWSQNRRINFQIFEAISMVLSKAFENTATCLG